MNGNIFTHHESLIGKPIAALVVIGALDVIMEGPVGSSADEMTDLVVLARSETHDTARSTVEFPQMGINVAFGIQRRD